MSADPGPEILGPVRVRSQVREGQDRTLDSLGGNGGGRLPSCISSDGAVGGVKQMVIVAKKGFHLVFE